MSINLPAPATWSLVNYGTGTPIFADGFVNGNNTYGDREKAMYFDASASANTLMTQVYVGFDHAYSATPTKTVAIKVYDGSSGTPGATLGTGTISMATIMTDVTNNQYTLLIFPTPINLPASKRFFVSVDVSGLSWGAIKDSLSIVSNSDPQTIPTQTWEKWSTNAWYRYDNASSWQLDISLLIHPFLRSTPMTASMTATPGNTICSGQTINYNSAGSTTGGIFEWYFGSIPTPSATGATTMATYPAAGTFTTILLVEDACGSLAATSRTITVNPSPTVTASPSSTTVCNGSNVTLNGGGAFTYTWTGGISNNTPFVPPSTNNYTVTGTAANGCTAQAVAAVNVNPIPAPTLSSNSPVCSNLTINLSSSSIIGATYQWSGPGSFTAATQNPNIPGAASSNAGVYTASVTALGCTGIATVAVLVNTTPTANAISGGSITCASTTQTLSGSGVTSYTWSGPGIVAGGNTSTPTVNAVGNYTLIGSDATGCISAPVTTGVFSNTTPPTMSVSASSNSICAGASATISLISSATTQTWSTGANTTSIVVTPSTNATYTVTGTDSGNGCSGSTVQSIGVNALPTITASSASPVICGPPFQQTVTITAGGASTYTWNTSAISSSISVSPSVTTVYTVTGTDANGCENMTSFTQSVSACTGMQQFGVQSSEFVVYPNPNNGEFTISLTGSEKNPSVEIYNTIGKLVYQDVLTAEKTTFNTNLAAGIYFINLIDNGKVIAAQKLICK